MWLILKGKASVSFVVHLKALFSDGFHGTATTTTLFGDPPLWLVLAVFAREPCSWLGNPTVVFFVAPEDDACDWEMVTVPVPAAPELAEASPRLGAEETGGAMTSLTWPSSHVTQSHGQNISKEPPPLKQCTPCGRFMQRDVLEV